MSLVNFTSLDFDQIKTSIRDYLRSNSNFTDYDFEGSNMSVLIDMLAYNTYISSYNANMVSNEVFIDSATLRENVVSLARNIGYIPSSRKSAKANISFFVEGMIRVAINGFGRIGRNVLRAALGHSKYLKKFEIVVVNDLGNTEQVLKEVFGTEG